MADVQIAVIDQQNTQIALAAPSETEVTVAVPGVQGPVGEGVPAGGTANQVLFKQSGTDYDTAWSEITSEMIGDLEIVNADVATNAAIAGTKISPNFGSQNVVTTGTATAAALIPSGSSVPTNGVYLPSANNVAISTNGTGRLFISSTGAVTTADEKINLVRVGRGAGAVSSNTVMGEGALTSNTTGGNNTAIGLNTLYYVITGSNNTAVGHRALQQNTANNNTAVGSSALFTNSSGSDNTALGYYSLLYNNTGSNNTAIGRYSLLSNTTGANNIGLGYGAGQSITTGSNNVIIGNIAGTASLGNTMIFGDGAGNERFRVDSSGRLGLGTSSPSTSLHVYSAASTADSTRYNLLLQDSTSYAQGVGGGINFGFKYNSTGNLINRAAGIAGIKENGTDGNYAGALTFYTTQNSASTGERMRIDSSGNVGIGTTSVSSQLHIVPASDNNFTNGLRVSRAAEANQYGTFNYSGGALNIIATDSTVNVNPITRFYRSTNGSTVTESMRIDSSGRLLVGTSSARSDFYNANSVLPVFQVQGEGNNRIASITAVDTSSVSGAGLILAKSRGVANTIVQSGDYLGGLSFQGADGTELVEGARIDAIVDGTPGANDLPTRLEFATTADGSSSPTERLRIDSQGRVGIGTASPQVNLDIAPASSSATLRVHARTDTSPIPAIELQRGAGTTWGSDVYGDYRIKNDASELIFEYGQSGSTTERARIDSYGRLLVGTSSSSADTRAIIQGRSSAGDSTGKLYISSGNNTPADGDGIAELNFSPSNHTATARIAVQRDGGTWTAGSSQPSRLEFSTTADGASSPTERMRISSDGNILQSKASGTVQNTIKSSSIADTEAAEFIVNGISGGTSRFAALSVYKHSGITQAVAYLYLHPEDGAGNFIWVDNSDILRISTTQSNVGTTGGTVVGTQTSDERIKNVLGPVEYGLETLKQVETVRYSLKSQPDIEHLGFIAQQVQPLIPQSVFDTNEHIEGEPEDAPTKLGMEYVALIPVLVNAIKELSAEVDALKAQLQAQ